MTRHSWWERRNSAPTPARETGSTRPGDAPDGYLRYRDDALSISFSLPADDNNLGLVNGNTTATLPLSTQDMTGQRTDANPATVARWEGGSWAGYEDSDGVDGSNSGGFDQTIQLQLTSETLGDPFVIEAGTSSAWYDPARNGEGFMLEILAGNAAVMYWFTYDGAGAQDWYIAQGEIRGNRILFPALMQGIGRNFRARLRSGQCHPRDRGLSQLHLVGMRQRRNGLADRQGRQRPAPGPHEPATPVLGDGNGLWQACVPA